MNPPDRPVSHLASRRKDWLQLALICLLTAAALAPFLARPLHIDDPMFVWAAKHIVAHPLDFYGFSVNWEGTDRPFNRIFPIPPLTSYLLAGISHMAGWSVIHLHLAFLPISVLAAAGTFLLAGRFTSRPWLCALLLIFSPAFWVSATTLMCDTLLLCLWVWSIVFWIWGSEKSMWHFIPCAIALAAAMLTKFTGLALIPLLILHALLHPAPLKIRVPQLFSLALPLAVIAVYNAIFARLYGAGALQNAAFYASQSRAVLDIPIGVRALNTLAFVGGCGLSVGLFSLVVLCRPGVWAATILGIIVVALLLAANATPPSGWTNHSQPMNRISAGSIAFFSQYAWMLSLALVLIVCFIRSFLRARRIGVWRDEAFLLSWIAGIFVFAGFINWSINARTLSPMIPALCILTVRIADRLPSLPKIRTSLALALGAAVGLAVAIGDYQLARTGKTAAEILRNDPESEKHTRIWITGHWGFQYYAQLAGFEELDSLKPQFHTDDDVVFPASGFGGAPQAAGFVLIKTITVGTDHWATTAVPTMGGGFYHSDGYLLPFVFGPIPAESFSIVKATEESRVSP
jgi:hypothetical protein